ncbi:MAG TPA: inosine/xanthosine triphosphatase [Anaerolineaceae bacterium]|jgi:inosine/xanthosine triphosphatase|nr:inosine/xanthosine triphosphatase [Anaerolineaceae bacterium]HNS38135.1 inosine/xanthosine triphosphatase [Anaerolineaceae bacterium]HOD03555.1 inosine/xanthosine triphosphatase [Anaerolineaceae bacterium]HOG78162.1 inosine/xanthosine triphosphatase [Anaerolineaceae bacterium]
MPRVVVASKNPVKIESAQLGFARMFPSRSYDFIGVSVPSGVSAQPFSDLETYQGARQRALNARQAHPDADYWVGIEGGVDTLMDDLIGFAWVVICSAQQMGWARTGTFCLPPQVSKLVRQGKELGEADDIVFSRSNSKQENGAVGILTDNAINRTQFYEPAVMLALIPFKNPELYPADIRTDCE